MNVLSTYKILKAKAFKEPVDESWILWAMEMIEAGYESGNLYMLAGEMPPYNQFALADLTDRVFEDLELDHRNRKQVIQQYVYYLIAVSVDHPESYMKTLRALKDICLELNYSEAYMGFYRMYYAKEELETDGIQWYLDDVTEENIDGLIRKEFMNWLSNNKPNT